MIANTLIVIGLVSLGAIIGVAVMAMAQVAARDDRDREQYRAGYAQGERSGYLTGWRAARRAWGGRRGKAEEVA